MHMLTCSIFSKAFLPVRLSSSKATLPTSPIYTAPPLLEEPYPFVAEPPPAVLYLNEQPPVNVAISDVPDRYTAPPAPPATLPQAVEASAVQL